MHTLTLTDPSFLFPLAFVIDQFRKLAFKTSKWYIPFVPALPIALLWLYFLDTYGLPKPTWEYVVFGLILVFIAAWIGFGLIRYVYQSAPIFTLVGGFGDVIQNHTINIIQYTNFLLLYPIAYISYYWARNEDWEWVGILLGLGIVLLANALDYYTSLQEVRDAEKRTHTDVKDPERHKMIALKTGYISQENVVDIHRIQTLFDLIWWGSLFIGIAPIYLSHEIALIVGLGIISGITIYQAIQNMAPRRPYFKNE